ncbi:putative ABC transport system permease protein [Roseimicrobium gellanilyticum]|uniref:Putative ABC transport system permease protein n=1 Tax=Roseimicrobium gellanilyticum TaxID=748857 RepID=A0A366HPJ8_9BACT|nr:ABC transporter permease [Roseimicrobium gellanilyticum]RBP45417.1 putative ABC transport system permease protein [Roseimicrobium gellanilyticum]
MWRSIVLGSKSIWLHKLRSMLTALGVVFGVASVVAMLAIGEGASHEAQEQIRKLGSQNVILESVKPPDNQGPGQQTRSMVLEYGLTTRDINQIRQTIPGISIVVPSRMISENLWNESYNLDASILGVLSIYPEMRNRKLSLGRFFTEVEYNDRIPVCVLNQTAAAKLFPLATPVGKSVRVRGFYYRVVGVIEDESMRSTGDDGAPKSGGTKSNSVGQMLIPFSTLMDHYGDTFFRFRSGSFEAEKVEFHEAIVRVDDVNAVMTRAEAIRHVLARNHPREDYRVTVPIELLRQAERTKRIFSIVLGSIAAISLLVGGIGIMNIMLASVTERTREIGIRRALGARQTDIVLQFLIETVLLAGAGGVIGVVLGLGIPIAISHFAGVTTVIKAWAPTLAFSISVFTGIAFGIYPAMRAAKMNPVEALRHE